MINRLIRHMTGMMRNQRGVALLITLWILVFLIIIVSEFTYVIRIELKISNNLKEETQAYFLALAGVESAIHEIMGDYRFQYLDPEGRLIFAPGNEMDYLSSASTDQQILVSAPQRSSIAMKTGLFSYMIVDQERKFNINSLRNRNPRPDSPFNKFKLILIQSGVPVGVELDTITDSIIDWLDNDEDHGLNGAETKWYENNYLEMGFIEPYQSKNGRFDTVEELLMVRGMTPEILYGTARAHEMGLYERDKDKDKDEEAETYLGIYDYLCASPHSSSRMNINTVSEELLTIMYPDLAPEIIMEREANGGIYPVRGRSRRVSSMTNRSYTFEIISTGRVTGSEVTRTIKCIVWKRGSKASSRLTYLYWNDMAPISTVETNPTSSTAEMDGEETRHGRSVGRTSISTSRSTGRTNNVTGRGSDRTTKRTNERSTGRKR